MATLEELKTVLQETLEARGTLDKLRAQVRAEIFHTLEGGEQREQLSNDNLIVNELIHEYLVFNKYYHADSVFMTESGQPRDSLARPLLAEAVGVREDHKTRSRPLLYTLASQRNSTIAQHTENETKQSRHSTSVRASTKPSVNFSTKVDESVGVSDSDFDQSSSAPFVHIYNE
ncbi:hypothetical protein PROFUN_03673 [Planoprotostelium fungivorum]|uniref:Centrosomal protein 43 n=1 Tax=Planoprotostelium fungivorum TaxID=1890364 RepID=A0A2P6NSJ0_9EUKA|nr:hypothetical protein PROFUN_03673 [Planoprotostelium fungivorum]